MQSYECPPKPTWTTHDSMDNFPLPPVQLLPPPELWRDAAPSAAAVEALSPAAEPFAPAAAPASASGGGELPPAAEGLSPPAAGEGLGLPAAVGMAAAPPPPCDLSPLERLASSEAETRLGWIQTGRPKGPLLAEQGLDPLLAEGLGPPVAFNSFTAAPPRMTAAVAAAEEVQQGESPSASASRARFPAGDDIPAV